MTTQILPPKLGFSVNEARVAEWLVADGTSVKKGQPLYAIVDAALSAAVE